MHRVGVEGKPEGAAGGDGALTAAAASFSSSHGDVAISPSVRRPSPEAVSALAILGVMLAVFLLAYFLPFQALPAGGTRLTTAGREALLMSTWTRSAVMKWSLRL